MRPKNKVALAVELSISQWKLCCQRNQSSYTTEIKNMSFVEGNVLCKYAKFQLDPPYDF